MQGIRSQGQGVRYLQLKGVIIILLGARSHESRAKRCKASGVTIQLRNHEREGRIKQELGSSRLKESKVRKIHHCR